MTPAERIELWRNQLAGMYGLDLIDDHKGGDAVWRDWCRQLVQETKPADMADVIAELLREGAIEEARAMVGQDGLELAAEMAALEQAEPLCPDPDGHWDLEYNPAQERRQPAVIVAGRCVWCGLRLPSGGIE